METPEPKASKTDLSSLNDRQREAVISEQKHLLVLAGAGSGKTKTLLQKLVCQVSNSGASVIKNCKIFKP